MITILYMFDQLLDMMADAFKGSWIGKALSGLIGIPVLSGIVYPAMALDQLVEAKQKTDALAKAEKELGAAITDAAKKEAQAKIERIKSNEDFGAIEAIIKQVDKAGNKLSTFLIQQNFTDKIAEMAKKSLLALGEVVAQGRENVGKEFLKLFGKNIDVPLRRRLPGIIEGSLIAAIAKLLQRLVPKEKSLVEKLEMQ